MLEDLKREVCEANLQLVRYGLVTLTWGNVSAITEDRKYVVIKPSGVPYERMRPEDMVVTGLSGTVVEGMLNPSSDLDTHLELYRNFPGALSIVHTHSRWATAWAQAELDLPCYGTTHADHFYGAVPCTRSLTEAETATQYELNTGKVIVETFTKRHIDPERMPAVLVCKHGPFAWGTTVRKAVENALVLDETAHMAILSKELNRSISPVAEWLLNRHFFRKHGENAYYGQSKSEMTSM